MCIQLINYKSSPIDTITSRRLIMPSSASEAEFLLSCIMHTDGKTDFEAVAKETGYTNPGSAFNRLTAIKRSFLAKNNTAGNGTTKSTAASPIKKKAPAAPRKARKPTL
ncbi:hypothetical protein DFP73DRAFT_555133, partial [Morchella snyderi]